MMCQQNRFKWVCCTDIVYNTESSTMTESVGNETIEKYWCFFFLEIGTDRMF
jgi:hypothetical protein